MKDKFQMKKKQIKDSVNTLKRNRINKFFNNKIRNS